MHCPNTKDSFESCSALQAINNMVLDSTTDCQYFFRYCSSLTDVSLTINSADLASTTYMFQGCTGLHNLNLEVQSLRPATGSSPFTCNRMFYNTNLANLSSSSRVKLDFSRYNGLFDSSGISTLSFLAN